jgi:hypothetical protein
MGQLDSYGGNIFIENTTTILEPPPPTLLTTQRLQQRANANFFFICSVHLGSGRNEETKL